MSGWTSLVPPIVGAITGFVVKLFYDRYAELRRFKKELEDNNHIDVSGEWYAAWQTSVDNELVINTEHLRLQQKGKTVKISNTERSPENPKGGYFWDAQMQFFQGKNLMGWYFAKPEESNASKGMMYLSYLSPRKIFYGKWVGTAYDGDLVTGYVVISKDRAASKNKLEEFMQNHPQDIRLITYDGIHTKTSNGVLK